MKSLLHVLLTFFVANSSSAGKEQVQPNAIPKVTIFYASTFDSVCASKTAYTIEQNWVKELKNKLPSWKKLWKQEGDSLLRTTSHIIGKPFEQSNFQVSLSLCSFPSMSAPLIVNSRYALHSFTEHTISNSAFINTIYHELLHNYIDTILPQKTPLLIKYKNETKGVLGHLHLFALEKMVYMRLGWHFKLKQVIEKDKSLPNKEYTRAWEIINKEEKAEHFIAELKLYSSSRVLHPDEI